jgi:hypothetical protein
MKQIHDEAELLRAAAHTSATIPRFRFGIMEGPGDGTSLLL